MEILPIPNEKKEVWRQALQRLENVVDGLGKRIDDGARETVAAFNVNGFPTYGSCEGHFEERPGRLPKLHPYIAVGLNEPEQRFVGEKEIRKQIADKFHISPDKLSEGGEAGKAYWNYIKEHGVEETEEYKAVREENIILRKRFFDLFAEFQKSDIASPEMQLSIQDIGAGGHFRIESRKKNPKKISADQIPALQEELAREKAEMSALTEFLKQRFFSIKGGE